MDAKYIIIGVLIQQILKSIDFNIFVVLISVSMGSGTVLLYCYVGTFTTTQFLYYADATYESAWYSYPLNMQKAVQMIIADAQRPLIFYGFGVIDLNLITFTKVRAFFECDILQLNVHNYAFQVMKTVVSYYLMFKRLTE